MLALECKLLLQVSGIFMHHRHIDVSVRINRKRQDARNEFQNTVRSQRSCCKNKRAK